MANLPPTATATKQHKMNGKPSATKPAPTSKNWWTNYAKTASNCTTSIPYQFTRVAHKTFCEQKFPVLGVLYHPIELWSNKVIDKKINYQPAAGWYPSKSC